MQFLRKWDIFMYDQKQILILFSDHRMECDYRRFAVFASIGSQSPNILDVNSNLLTPDLGTIKK